MQAGEKLLDELKPGNEGDALAAEAEVPQETDGGTLPWLPRQFGLARHGPRLESEGLDLEKLLRLLSEDSLGLLDRLESAGVVQPSEQARVLEAVALIDEGGITVEAVAGRARQQLLAPTGLTIEGLREAGVSVPESVHTALEEAGMTDAEEQRG